MTATPHHDADASAPHAQPRRWVKLTVLFLGGQAISLFGSSLVQFALLWYVTMGTQSGSMVTIATVVGFVPMMILAPFGGMWADRLNRRYLIAAADGLVALSTLALLLAFVSGHRGYALVFIAMAIRAFGGGVQGPAVGALLPQIVPAHHLGAVNGYNASIQAAVNLVAPMVAGALFAFASIEWILVIDLATAAIGIGILLLFVKVPAHAAALESPAQSGWMDLREGALYVHRHTFLRRIIGYFALSNFLVAPVAFLTPLQVTRTFANDPQYLAAVEVAFAVGMLIGGIAIGAWGGFSSRVTTVGVAILLLGVLTIALGVPITFSVYCVWMFLAGLVLPSLNTPAITMLQIAVDERFMGRVFSIATMISVGAMPLAMVIFGPLSDHISIESILIATGGLTAVLGIALLLDKAAHANEPRLPV